MKHDQDKLRYDLIPPIIEEEMAKVLTHGSIKYSDDNWKGVKPFRARYYAALRRHLNAWYKGELIDKESGLRHISQVMTNAGFLLWGEMK